jgi:hypothetical protein
MKQTNISIRSGWFLSIAAILALPGYAVAEGRAPDPAPDRIVYSTTALPNERNGARVSAFELGVWEGDWSVNRNLNVGVQGVPPVGILVIGPTFRAVVSISDIFHVGVTGRGGVIKSLLSDHYVIYYGGGPIATLGTSRAALSVSLLAYGASTGHRSGMAWLPNVGATVQVTDNMKLNVEAFSLNSKDFHKAGQFWAILYGLRFFGDKGNFFGDFGFMAPVFHNVGKFYRWAPLGLPIIGLGYKF